MRALQRHYEGIARLRVPADKVFAYLDDHTRLSSHMTQSSWMMGGARMSIDFDKDRGQRVGLRIRMAGKMFGVELSLDEVVTERTPPARKVWETVGTPRLLVISHYRMGFDINDQQGGSLLRIFIDYSLPENGFQHWLGRLFGDLYSKWCVNRMLGDAAREFKDDKVSRRFA